MIDTSGLAVVDVHCHPFGRQESLTPEQFTEMVAFPGGGMAYMVEGGLTADGGLAGEIEGVRRNTVYFRYLLRELAAFFGCEPALDQVVERRNRAAQEHYAGHVKRLFADCGLSTLVADFGYPQPPVDVAEFREAVPAEVVPIYRIEPLIAGLLKTDLGWDDFARAYDVAIGEAIEKGGYRGLKSIIAYRTGLEVSPLSRSADQGRQALDAIRRGTGGQATKKLRDHLLCRAMERCMDYDVPMQIHTGIGDYEVNLVSCRPALLMDLLRFPAFRACKVVLVHGGYPYVSEAGYMANVLPRVYCEASEGIPFAAHAAGRIYLEMLEMAPFTKVMYGSDGIALPEVHYVGAKLGKRALGQALEHLMDGGMLAQGEAEEVARRVLAQNARELYKLD